MHRVIVCFGLHLFGKCESRIDMWSGDIDLYTSDLTVGYRAQPDKPDARLPRTAVKRKIVPSQSVDWIFFNLIRFK